MIFLGTTNGNFKLKFLFFWLKLRIKFIRSIKLPFQVHKSVFLSHCSNRNDFLDNCNIIMFLQLENDSVKDNSSTARFRSKCEQRRSCHSDWEKNLPTLSAGTTYICLNDIIPGRKWVRLDDIREFNNWSYRIRCL